jgi:hypothetical protein
MMKPRSAMQTPMVEAQTWWMSRCEKTAMSEGPKPRYAAELDRVFSKDETLAKHHHAKAQGEVEPDDPDPLDLL